jgi:23S rRNA (uracil1939-C5)-methyltransferase
MQAGDRLTVRIEKPAAGGRMIARHDGAILLVAAAIPGEVVDVVVDRLQRKTAWASVTRVVEASPDRVDPGEDPACGGSVYAHVKYERQLALKRDILSDAFARLARITLPPDVPVRGSSADGYRMRARLHLRAGRLGFFREGTHELCDPATTRQLLPSTLDTIRGLASVLASAPRANVTDVEIAENVAGTERACHLELSASGDPSRLAAATMPAGGLRGISYRSGGSTRVWTLWGEPSVTDELTLDLGSHRTPAIRLTRRPHSFFQGNRHLVGQLASRVVTLAGEGPVVDLYAGVGLFAIALAARGPDRVLAVEGDLAAVEDLRLNAAPFADRLTVRHQPVERLEPAPAGLRDAAIVVDPPRTGLSREALRRLTAWRPPRVVYVSCDVATLARDARALVDAGYSLAGAEAFDLFPDTAHVESLVTFERR